MTPRRKKRLAVVLSIFIGMSLTISLILYGLSQNMNLFYTPTELILGRDDGHKPIIGERLRIGGLVVEGSVKRDENSLKIEFELQDVGPKVIVEYNGILPDLFREGQGIVAQGILIEPNRIEATEVLAKHDEEYLPPEITEAMEKNHNPLSYTEKQLKGDNQ